MFGDRVEIYLSEKGRPTINITDIRYVVSVIGKQPFRFADDKIGRVLLLATDNPDLKFWPISRERLEQHEEYFFREALNPTKFRFAYWAYDHDVRIAKIIKAQ